MDALPEPLARFLCRRHWHLFAHQRELLRRADEPATLLVAPTGGGKTLAGFLPTLADLARGPTAGLHTIYISPLKALATDVARNLTAPIAEAGLAVRVEDRTGDTPQGRRLRQRVDPPHILLTTPESLALLISYPEAPRLFAGLSRVIVDEIHALAESKRGDQLALCLARLQRLAPGLRRAGLSATVEDPPALARFLAPAGRQAHIITAEPGPAPDIGLLETEAPPPWAGGGGRHAVPEVLEAVRAHRTSLIFHNTRAQAELFFRALWEQNHDNLPIALHHGSLAREARRKVERAMADGALRGVVCTGTLDLGLDWGDVDLVLQIGAPKNVKRLVQRIGRSGHRYNAPSKARLVPANRFELLECRAALDAVVEGALDDAPRGPGPRDVLCQHILISTAAGPVDAGTLFDEVRAAAPYADLSRAEFDRCLDFVATGGYALRAYDRWQRLRRGADGLWSLRDPRAAAHIRRSIGTIAETDTLPVRLRRSAGGAVLGEIEEGFAATLKKGETFLIGGRVVRFESLTEMVVEVSPAGRKAPRIATFMGTKFAASTELCARMLALIAAPPPDLPAGLTGWLALQARASALPEADRLLVETFRHGGRAHLAFYGFAGRNAQQTLGLLVSRRMEASGLGPLGLVATDYATLIRAIETPAEVAPLFDPATLRGDFDDWLGETAVMKRAFRQVAGIAGLIERVPLRRKTGRQAQFSTDILHDTLRRHDPGHVLLDMTRAEAMRGLVDFSRIEEMLERISGRIDHRRLARVSPFAAPLLLEAGRVPVAGQGTEERLIGEAALMAEAGLVA